MNKSIQKLGGTDMNGYVIALDQGTTSSRAIIFDAKGTPVTVAQYPFPQIYPEPGWVEHDPMVILETQLRAMAEAFEKSGLSPTDIAGIGITNQRETTIVWDKNTGKPVYNAIVWQCRRTASICDELKASGIGEYVREKTGLLIDAYFSGTKIKWILDNRLSHTERALFLIFTENMSNYAKTSKQINCSIPTLRKYIGMIRQKITDNI